MVHVALVVQQPATSYLTPHVSLCISLDFTTAGYPITGVLSTRVLDTSRCTSSTRRVKPAPAPCRTSTLECKFRFIDCHLAITSLLKHFADTIERVITSLHTQTARKRKQTRINIFKRSRAHHRPHKKVNPCWRACMVHVSVCATDVAANPHTISTIFDTDSIQIRVDNCLRL